MSIEPCKTNALTPVPPSPHGSEQQPAQSPGQTTNHSKPQDSKKAAHPRASSLLPENWAPSQPTKHPDLIHGGESNSEPLNPGSKPMQLCLRLYSG